MSTQCVSGLRVWLYIKGILYYASIMRGLIIRNFSSTRWLIVLITIFILSGAASAQALTLKTARVSGVTGQWKGVSFGQTITNPIVVAGPLSNVDTQPAGVRVRNVTATGF